MSLKKEKRSIEATLTDSDEEADTSLKLKDSSARPVKNDRSYSSANFSSKLSELGETISKRIKNEASSNDFNDLKHKFDSIENEADTLNNNKRLKTESARPSFADKMMVPIFAQFNIQ